MARHSRPFEANWDSRCGLCDDDIYAGDEICYYQDEVCHVSCAEKEDDS
jgi:hypothetical protein